MKTKFRIIILVILLLILFIYNAFFWGQGFFAILIFTLIPIGLIITSFLISIILFFFNIKKPLKITSWLIIIIIISSLTGLSIGYYKDKIATARAEILIKALKDYKIKNGKYPESIKLLLPKYLPYNYNQTGINYECYKGNDFKITIHPINCGKIFESQYNEWHYRPCP
jgi:hypothetical protein